MKRTLVAFGAGLLFALGLGMSGMTHPTKVLAFLDLTANWDPSLAFVMAGGVLVNFIVFRLALRRGAPLLAPSFSIPPKGTIDMPLVVGATIFGVGWGMGGFCPGPALVSLAGGATPVIAFVLAMVVGMLANERTLRRSAARAVVGFIIPSLLLFGCAAGEGMRFQVINMERPPEGLGLPPPDYEPCYVGEARAYDRDGDGKTDEIRVSLRGRVRCYGEDTNHDGVIDTWDVMDESGKLTKRAHDADGDGRVDQSWTFDPTRKGCAMIAADRNGDGKPDPGVFIDVCGQLSNDGGR